MNAVLNVKQDTVPPDHIQVIKNKRNKLVMSVNHSLYGTLGIALSLVMAWFNTKNAQHSAFIDFSQYVSYVSYPLTYAVVHGVGSVLTLFKPIKYTLAIPGILLTSPYLIKCHKTLKLHNENEAMNCRECLLIAKEQYIIKKDSGKE